MSPADIETTRFPTAIRGYDRAAVDAFLERLAFLLRYAGAHYGIDWDDDVFVEALVAHGLDTDETDLDADVDDADVDDAETDLDADVDDAEAADDAADSIEMVDAASTDADEEYLPPVLSEEQADRIARQLLDAVHRIEVTATTDDAFVRRSSLHEVRSTD